MPSLAQFITWIVMGLLGGSLAGLIVTRGRKGFGLARNMGLGLAGAIVGGLLFRLLGLLPGLDQISISLRDVVSSIRSAAFSNLTRWRVSPVETIRPPLKTRRELRQLSPRADEAACASQVEELTSQLSVVSAVGRGRLPTRRERVFI